jgi:hypothetical protein
MTQAAMACKPNFSGAGRRRRLRVGVLFAVLSVALAATFIVLHVSWYLRLSLFIPVAATTITLLQVSRNARVAHDAKGTLRIGKTIAISGAGVKNDALKSAAVGVR